MAEDPTEQPPAKRVRYDFSQSFDVLVGPERKRFTICHDLFIERSGFFKAARSSRWTKDSQTPTDLTDHQPADFSNYLQIVYTGTVHLPEEKVSQWLDDGCPEHEWHDVGAAWNLHCDSIIALFVLADKLQDLSAANLAMDNFMCFCDRGSKMISSWKLERICNLTPPNSPLRAAVRDMIIYESCVDYFEDNLELPPELLLDIAKEHRRIRHAHPNQLLAEAYPNGVLKKFPSKCQYHQHNDEHPKCK